MIAGYIFSKSLDETCGAVYKFIKKYAEKNQLEKLVYKGISAYDVEFDGLSDFKPENKQSLKAYIDEVIFTEITACFLLPKPACTELEKHLFSCAYEKANAQTALQQRQVGEYLRGIISIARNALLNKEDNLLAPNYVVDEVNAIVDSMGRDFRFQLETTSNKIIKELDTIKAVLEYRYSFAELIDAISLPLDSNTQFHYRNSTIGFYGRENEINFLDKFLDNDSKLLFAVITGSAGTGKSKLLYEYAKIMTNNSLWKTVFFLNSKDITKVSGYPKCDYHANLLIVIDYAGNDVANLGEWLSSLGTKQLQNKIRIVLLEREGISKKDENSNESKQCGSVSKETPYWYDRLLNSINSVASIKDRISFLELDSLTSADLENMLDDYAKSKRKEFTSEQKKAILSYCSSIEKVGERVKGVRPLIALFVADAWINNESYGKWDLDELLNQLIERYRRHWEKTFCGNDCVTRMLLEKLLVYATATGGWTFSDKANLPGSLKKPLSQLQAKFLEKSELQKVLQGLNEKTTWDGILFPMEPDLIGEFLVLNYVQNSEYEPQSLVSAFEQKVEYLSFLARCINDYATVPRFKNLFENAMSSLISVDLLNKYPLPCAWLLVNLSYDQDVVAVARIVEVLCELTQKYPTSEELAFEYAKGLVNLSCDQDVVAREQTVNILCELAQKYPTNKELANAYAEGLDSISNKRNTSK